MPEVHRIWLIPLISIGLAPAQPAPGEFLQPERTISSKIQPGVPMPILFPELGIESALTRDGAIWFGTSHGLWRVDLALKPARWQYFAGQRYLPSDAVLSLAPVERDPHSVWVTTQAGTSKLELRPMTLETKAGLFEQRVERRHNRHGMVADSRLTRPGDLASNQTESSDNDGLWTAIYGASQCFRYAVTQSEEARERAERSVETLLRLEKITGIPGFPARSYIVPGDIQPDDGIWVSKTAEMIRWKADTSSDEIVGHFFLFSVAFDTLPDPELRRRIASTTRRIMDHIISHGYYLIDRTGKPTTWGKWSPAYFATKGGRPDSPLNALELLSFLRAARHITGDTKYDIEYEKVARKMGYAAITARYRELAEEINYSDEELAMLSFYTLFRYERDASLMPVYRKALGDWWHNIQRERNPLWNVIYLHSQPDVAPAERERLARAAITTLEEIPLDLVTWTVDNTYRRDIVWDRKADRFNVRQSTTWISPAERPVMKWNGNPFEVDGGEGGQREDDGSFYLLPYWLGRFWKFW